MRVIPPVTINSLRLQSSTVSGLHVPLDWSSGSTYSVGQIVKVPADFAIYECLAQGNLNNTPATSPAWWRKLGPTETAWAASTSYVAGASVSYGTRLYSAIQAHTSSSTNRPPTPPETENSWWVDVGPTNAWAMFDLASSIQTVAAPNVTLSVTVVPGERINSIGLTGLDADFLTITVTSGGSTVYSRSVDLRVRTVLDAYDYAFEPFMTLPSVVYFDIPPLSDSIVSISLSSISGNTKCGAVVLGTYVYLGAAQQNASNDATNFSTIDRDIYGTATLVPRRSVPKIKVTTEIAAGVPLNRVRNARVALNAVPALYSSLEDPNNPYFDTLLLLGVYKLFEISAPYPEVAVVNFEIEAI